MVHDVLGLKLNKVIVSEGGGSGPQPSPAHPPPAGKKATYDVDEKDFFWEACGGYPFPRQVWNNRGIRVYLPFSRYYSSSWAEE